MDDLALWVLLRAPLGVLKANQREAERVAAVPHSTNPFRRRLISDWYDPAVPEFMNFTLFGKTMLVALKKFGLCFVHPRK